MGNSLGGKKTVKIMKISGETFKLKTPVKAGEVIKDYPGLVLLESEAVKHYGVRAKPLEPHQELVPKRLYFLVELPKASAEKAARRVRSGINMSAKDRLESLMLARRSTSDLSIINPSSSSSSIVPEQSGPMRVKMRLPKAEVEKLMQESKDDAEAAAKIMELCIANKGGKRSTEIAPQQQVHLQGGHGRAESESVKARVSSLGGLLTDI
ncbi:hypothetical protein GH714_042100 [Hevea brasiliensis]|uniref:Plastid movement impaired 2 n=1 Tax=Hevea brasiliensis TaxID=3981 RepID=A0A6A6MY59_HEVBR|nr:hypothetical protein GH714_042100 [Hevea brasiliensis]